MKQQLYLLDPDGYELPVPGAVAQSGRQQGKLLFWRYTENERNYPGWHFMVDHAGGRSVAALVTALAGGGPVLTHPIVVSPPSVGVLGIPKNRKGQASWASPKELRLSFAAATPDTWSIEGNGTSIDWRFGTRWAPVIADAFSDPAKYFDSTIGDDPPVWSWGLFPATSTEPLRR